MAIDIENLKSSVLLHGKVARVAVVATKGSVPREAGTEMLVWEGGQLGTIGGGALEFQAVREAFSGDYLKTIPLGPDLGQCCGGGVTLVNEIFDLARLKKIEIGKNFLRRVSGAHQKPSAIIRHEESIQSSNCAIDETVISKGWVSEPTRKKSSPIWVYGAGHVGRAIIQTISPLPNFDLTWLDTGKDRFPEDVPSSVKVLYSKNLIRLSKYAPVNCNHIIITYSHALDLSLCNKILKTPFESLGLIGSRTKWVRFQKRLTELGHSHDRISQITCPIGSPELGKHPQAIAISLAQKLLVSHNQTTNSQVAVK
tara:strand:+ start:1543 stop:2478 length:936 start_codon:yes stop_codon:yes gene_type:complete